MKIGDVLQRDPAVYALPNDGQARITEGASEKEVRQLRDELSTFVCKGQFKDGMATILSSYVASLGQTNQKAAWVSGFFGSGKSHFLKMLGHLWQDTEFPDGATARSIVPALPDDVRDLLRELDTAGKRAGGLLAATGALPSGTTDNVRLTVLGILLRSVGLPAQYSQADFCLWLYDQGYYARVKAAVEASGKNWEAELNNLYVSGPIAQAVLKCDKNYAGDEKEARKTIKDQHPPRLTDVNTADFLRMAKRALRFRGRDGRPPCTVLVLDEVQQYIGQSNDRSTLVTEVVEAVSKQLDSQVMVVGAGQSALTDVPCSTSSWTDFVSGFRFQILMSRASHAKFYFRRNPLASVRFARHSIRMPGRFRANSRELGLEKQRKTARLSSKTIRCFLCAGDSGRLAFAKLTLRGHIVSSALSSASSMMR